MIETLTILALAPFAAFGAILGAVLVTTIVVGIVAGFWNWLFWDGRR